VWIVDPSARPPNWRSRRNLYYEGVRAGAEIASHGFYEEFAAELRRLRTERSATLRSYRELRKLSRWSPQAAALRWLARADSKAVLDEIRRLRRRIRALNSEIRRLIAVTAVEFFSTEITRTLQHTVFSHRTRGPDRVRKTSYPQVLREFVLT